MTLAIVFSAVALICYFTLMFVTLRRNSRKRTNQAFVLYLAAMTFWQFTALMVSLSQDAQAALFWYRAMIAGIAGPFIFFLFFTLVFLGEKRRGWYYAGWALLITLLASSGTDLVIKSVYVSEVTALFVPQLGPLVPAVAITQYLFLGYAAFCLGQGYRRTRSDLQRSRIRYLLFAAGAVAMGSFSNIEPALRAYPVDIAFNVLSAVLVGYAILRHRLLDVSVVVRKGLLYSIPTIIIGAAYFLIISFVVNLFHAFARPQIFLLSLLVAVITAVAAQPLRNKAQSAIDRLFFHERYDSRLMLQRLSGSAAYILDLDRIMGLILREVTTTMHIETAAFFLKQDGSGDFVLMAQQGLDLETNMQLAKSHGIVDWLSSHQQVLTRDDIEFMPQFKALWRQERKDLERIRAEILIPVKVTGELVGIFGVGPKLSEETYSQDDQLTLTTLANQTAIAIDNARLFGAVQQELHQRQRAEEELRRRAAHLEALNAIIAAAAASTDLNELLEGALHHTMRALGLNSGAIWLTPEWQASAMGQPQEVSPDADSSGAVQVLRGLSPEKGPILTQMACFGLPGFADPIVVEDLERTEFAVQAARTGMRAVLAAPIVIEGYRIGGLALVAHEPRHWSHEEIHLVEAVGQQLGTTAERLRLFYEVRMHAEQLEVALQQSQKLEQLKSEFIQNVSHELRTPLGLIRGYSELLNAGELGPLPPEQQSVVEIIVRRAQMLSELVEDITVILDAETRPLLRDRVAVDELARAAVEDFRIAADRSKLTLSLEIPSTVPQVFGQKAYLRRVLDNLIGNAVKFTTEGQSVTVRVGHEDSRVFLQVSDTGKGVPPEEQERIFERFYQVDGGIRRRYGGVGLGLALVKQVVESLGGEVTLQSEVGRGSTFTVWLPVAEEQ